MEEFCGVVLTGGRSSRMGRDKALLAVGDAPPMARFVADTLFAAGARYVFSVGGDGDALRSLGLDHIADDTPGEGPLGGIITALRNSPCDLNVVLACDTPWMDVQVPTALIGALRAEPGIGVCLASSETRLQPLTAAWRRSASLEELTRRFDAGERSPRRAVSSLPSLTVEIAESRWLEDVDSPEDLYR